MTPELLPEVLADHLDRLYRAAWALCGSREDAVLALLRTGAQAYAMAESTLALRHASHGYILESGRVVMDGAAASLLANDDVRQFYLGVGDGGRRSFRDVKSYKRRKRWLA